MKRNQKKGKKESGDALSAGHTYSLDEQESARAAAGAPTRGFHEDAQVQEYERNELSFVSPFDRTDPKTAHPSQASRPSDKRGTESLFEYDEAESAGESAGQVVAGSKEVYPGDPDIEASQPNDLRFGGEDISGVSEWSMRATHLELDDGLDAADFHRSDDEIRNEVYELFNERRWTAEPIECDVAGGEVKLNGRISRRDLREEIEAAVKDLPGVREVYNFLELARP